MKKRKNHLALFVGLALILVVLLGTLVFATANSDDNGNGGNSAKTFSIQSSDDFTKKEDISKLVVSAGQVFPIYIYAVNKGNAQSPEVNQDIPLQVTLFDPNNNQTFQTAITIPRGPGNTYATLDLSCPYPGKWRVKVYGNPGKGNVTVSGTFTVIGNQAALNVIPPEATILLNSTQKFQALFTDSQGNTTPISDEPAIIIPEAFNYALFSGSSTSTLSLNGTDIKINGSTHSNRGFIASVYKLNISETCEAVTTVQLNGNMNDIHIGEVVQNASSIVMPDVGNAIIAMAQATGQTYNGNKTYNDTNIYLNSPIYVDGNLTINCNDFSGIGPIVATGDITVNSTTLSVMNDAPVSLYSKNGNIKIGNNSVNLKGMVYAPNGTITMNGTYLNIYGRVIGNQVGIQVNQLNIDSSNNDLTSLIAGTEPQVKWSSSDPSVATIDPSGLATSIGLGTCLITGEYTINNVTYTDTSQLTVISPTLRIDPESAIIPLGSTQAFKAILEDSDGIADVTELVTWSSNGSSVATIESSGLATSKGVGTCTITAIYQIDGINISTRATLMVVNLRIKPENRIISIGSTQQYQAEFTDPTGKVIDVTPAIDHWSSITFDASVLAATISQSGLATANNLGFCTIQATYIFNGVSVTASTSLTVIKPTLIITPANQTILLGSEQQYQARLTDFDGHQTDVTESANWSSDETNIATIDTSGLATGSGVGTCIITGAYMINGVSIGDTTPLSVVNFSIIPTTSTISLGSTQQYKAKFTDAAGIETDVTQSPSLTWSSGSAGVATINSTGLATENGLGESVISATYRVDELSMTATASLIIVKPILSIAPIDTTISLGSTQQYQATLTDYEGYTTDVTPFVTWFSDKTSVATIDPSGLAAGSGGGTCTITGTYMINGVSLRAEAQLTVALPTLSIEPAFSWILLGSTQQYQAILTDFEGKEREVVTEYVEWSCDQPNIATIDSSSGLATGISAGTSIISATYIINGVSITASATLEIMDLSMVMTLIVKPVPVPMMKAIFVGDTQPFTAHLKYSDGTSTDVTERVKWFSSVSSVAAIGDIDEKKVLVSGISAGTSIISATLNTTNNSLSGSYLLKVLPINGGIIREWEL
ncbi:Ig-like domain-containing protein [Desulfosporosinus shakirovi]|uniref:Ig-like domain-containing protein n=1 Tax=Desulfosporosinus shakirovi TaxID=2885154 RepID=UPI001E50E42E|nr:Ig-like domain-containing protein [Desulfosporosinus sp. SRJS8]MCB8817979.1 Ig-like domain-containing protein [Desulfosporosinus sp. SRJS8]